MTGGHRPAPSGPTAQAAANPHLSCRHDTHHTPQCATPNRPEPSLAGTTANQLPRWEAPPIRAGHVLANPDAARLRRWEGPEGRVLPPHSLLAGLAPGGGGGMSPCLASPGPSASQGAARGWENHDASQPVLSHRAWSPAARSSVAPGAFVAVCSGMC